MTNFINYLWNFYGNLYVLELNKNLPPPSPQKKKVPFFGGGGGGVAIYMSYIAAIFWDDWVKQSLRYHNFCHLENKYKYKG